jgi:hypothetical protein
MSYEIRRANTAETIATSPTFLHACRWLISCASAFSGGDFEIWRVEKLGRYVTQEREALYTLDD